MTTQKSIAFPVEVEWFGARLTQCRPSDGSPLEVATPPIFPHGMEGFWSPEDMLVGAAASCFALTLVAACAARSIRLYGLRVKGVGHVGTRADSRYGFEGLELRVSARVSDEDRDVFSALVQKVSRGCIVGTALELPLHVELDVEEVTPVPRRRELAAQ